MDTNYNTIIMTSSEATTSAGRGGRGDDNKNITTSHNNSSSTIMSPLSSNIPYNEISIDEAVDKIGTGKFQHLLLFAAGTCFMADSMEIMLLSFLTLVLKRDWEWENEDTANTQLASIVAVMFIGALIGTSILGPFGDRKGRKPVLLLASFIISFFGVMTAFCDSVSSLLLVRFAVGFGIGGLTVPFDILAEFLPNESRGRYLLLIEYYWTAGSMLVPLVAYWTLETYNSWKIFVTVCAIPCFISFFAGMFFVPESPRWLVKQGRYDEALDILRKAAGMNGKDPNVIFPQNTRLEKEEEFDSSIKDLFTPRWKSTTLLLFVVWTGFAVCYYGVIMVITRIFNDEEQNDDDDIASFDYTAIFISSCAEVIGTAIAICFIDRIGRVPVIVSSYALGGISVFLMCVFVGNFSRSALVSIAFLARICEMVSSTTVWVQTAEIFPTEIRSTGHSATNAVARIGGFVSPYLVAGTTPLLVVGVIFLIVHMIAAFCSSRLPETRGQDLGKATEHELRHSSSHYDATGTELI